MLSIITSSSTVHIEYFWVFSNSCCYSIPHILRKLLYLIFKGLLSLILFLIPQFDSLAFSFIILTSFIKFYNFIITENLDITNK